MSDTSKSELAYQAIKQAVIEQALTPGTKLPEDMLGTHFNVSRTLIREALARLAADGLVETGRKRTATVAQPSREEAASVFEVRSCLEREVVRLVIARWTPAMGAVLEGHVRLEEQAAKQQQAAVSGRLAGEFHIKLAQLTGNPLIERYVSELVSRCSLILAVYGRPHAPDCAIGEHRALIAALRRGDTSAAAVSMIHHLDGVQDRALAPDTAPDERDLHSILGRYSAELLRGNAGTVPLAAKATPRKAARKPAGGSAAVASTKPAAQRGKPRRSA